MQLLKDDPAVRIEDSGFITFIDMTNKPMQHND